MSPPYPVPSLVCLDDALLVSVFQRLDPATLKAASRVCRRFCRLIDAHEIWRWLFKIYFEVRPRICIDSAIFLQHWRYRKMQLAPYSLSNRSGEPILAQSGSRRVAATRAAEKVHESAVRALHVQKSLVLSGDDRGCVRLWDRKRHVCLGAWQSRNNGITATHLSGNHFFAGTQKGDLLSWRLDQSGRPFHDSGEGGFSRVLALKDGAGGLDVIWANGLIGRLAVKSQVWLSTQSVAAGSWSTAFFGDGWVVAGEAQSGRGRQTRICVLDPSGRLPPSFLMGHESRINGFCKAEERLISYSNDATVKAWDLQQQQCVWTSQAQSEEIQCAAWSAHGLCGGLGTGDIALFDFRIGHAALRLQGHAAAALALRAWQDQLVSASSDGRIALWDLRIPRSMWTTHLSKEICSVSFALPELYLGTRCGELIGIDLKLRA